MCFSAVVYDWPGAFIVLKKAKATISINIACIRKTNGWETQLHNK